MKIRESYIKKKMGLTLIQKASLYLSTMPRIFPAVSSDFFCKIWFHLSDRNRLYWGSINVSFVLAGYDPVHVYLDLTDSKEVKPSLLLEKIAQVIWDEGHGPSYSINAFLYKNTLLEDLVRE